MAPHSKKSECKHCRELRRQLEDNNEAVGLLPPQYATALLGLAHLAHYGVKIEGGGSAAGKLTSAPPKHDPKAYKKLQQELANLRGAGRGINAFLDEIV